MKTAKIERWLLLEQSGELSFRHLRQLGRELDNSEKARELRDDLGRLKGSIITPKIEPAPWCTKRIDARLSQENRPSLNLYRVLKPALALAAGLVIVAGILNFHGEQTSSTSTAVLLAAAEVDVWNDPIGEDMGKLENLMVAISGDPLDIMEM
jgi:hypothetical protein